MLKYIYIYTNILLCKTQGVFSLEKWNINGKLVKKSHQEHDKEIFVVAYITFVAVVACWFSFVFVGTVDR